MSHISSEIIMLVTLKHLADVMLKVSRVMLMIGTSNFNSVRLISVVCHSIHTNYIIDCVNFILKYW